MPGIHYCKLSTHYIVYNTISMFVCRLCLLFDHNPRHVVAVFTKSRLFLFKTCDATCFLQRKRELTN